ncbi:DUF2167 domain-containing protein [Massilia sp. DWR3-1-1]|uniref:DUF2167 domain-containing protein n=1 Tax=Massilia sp. DWR3-1-1 TaxID=2804559 RepID=UPI003CF06F73
MNKLLALVVGALFCVAMARAQEAAAPAMDKDAFLASLHFQEGTIALPGKIATLQLPASFRYLPPADASRLLAMWGNPPDASTLGMIVPAAPGVLSEGGWAVVVTYDKDGHIKDDDADSINYDSLLKDMQASIDDGNAERKKQGYAGMRLQGWAERPSYDKASHKMYWAKQIRFDDSAHDTLNYNVRVLGREGVLVLNAVADAGQISQIKQDMRTVTGFTEFTAGNRYADFDSKTDKVAEYGLAALVAGGVAAKLGMFGKLFALLLAFKKIIFVAVAALGASVFQRFKGKAAAPPPVSLEKPDQDR